MNPLQVAHSSPARILVLNGMSSAGKSSLAKAMQAKSEHPLHHVQLDAFRDMEPPGYWDGWAQRDEDSSRRMMGALCGALYSTALEYSKHGQQVILDVALTHPQARSLLVAYLCGSPVYLIAVHCDMEELDRREQVRGNRPIGLARSQFEWLHRKMRYDAHFDTTHKAPAQVADEVLSWLSAAPAPSALSEMSASLNAA